MKNTRHLLMLFLLSVSAVTAIAQQWSDVGNTGFTSNILTSNFSGLQYVSRLAIYNNIPYVSYVNSNYDVDVMSYTGGSWNLITSPAAGGDPTTNPISNVHIAFDASGNLYLAYMKVSVIYVKKFNGTVWTTVSGGPVISNFLGGLAIDPVTNNPYVATINTGGTFKITVRKFNGTSWVDVGAPNFSGTTNRIRLAISSTGVPYVTARDGTSGTTFSVLKFDGTNWVTVGATGIGSLGNPVDFTDIAIDASGAPHIISLNATDNKANVLKFNGTNWVAVGQADFSAGAALQSNLKFDNSGVLHIVYQDVANGNKATVMKFNGTNWVNAGNAGLSGGGVYYPTLAFNSSNLPYVGFRDALESGAKSTVLKLCTSTTASITSAPSVTLCGAGPATLTATGTGTFKWYNSSGLYMSSGASFSFPSLTSTTTMSVAAYDASGCSSARTTVTATVNTVPTITATQPAGTCQGLTAEIGATASVGTISWYTTPTGGSPFATGIVSGGLVTTPVVNVTTPFYAEAVNNGCTSASRSAVQAIVNPTPATPTANDGSRCGPGSVSISVTSGAGSVQWFAASTGGSSLGTGTSFTTPSLTTTTTYYALLTGIEGCPALTRVPVAAIIKAIPTVTSTTPATRCGAGTVTLTATLSDEGGIGWYTAASGGSAVGTNSFTTPSLTATTTFFAEAVANGCSSVSRTPVVATIKPIPTITSADVSRCDAGTVTFEASSTGTISWFVTASGGSSIASGQNYTTPSLTNTTPYFIEAVLSGCTTPTRTQVNAIVNNTPVQPTISQNNSNIEAPVLTSSSASGNQWFKNDVQISGALNATYTVADGGSYKVQVSLNGCTSPFSSSVVYVITGLEIPSSESVSIYPNPTQEELILNLAAFELNKPVSVSVIDLMGRQWNNTSGQGGQELRMNVRQFEAGRYIVLMTQGKIRVAKTFIKSL